MGGTGSSRHVFVDSDDEGRVHFVKGIRLSDRVIDRMKESPRVVCPQASTESHSPSSSPEAVQVECLTPGECHRPIMPYPPSYASGLVPPPAPPSAPSPAQPEGLPASPVDEHVALPPTVDSASLPPPQPAEPINPPRVEPLTSLPAEEHVRPPFIKPEESQSPTSQTQAIVNEEELQKLIKDELKTEIKIRQQMDKERTKAEVQAHPTACRQEEQKTSHQQTLVDAIRMQQLNVLDERLIAQYYWMEKKAQKLDQKEKDLLIQAALFQEQITKLQKQTAQFCKVTAESYKKGLEDTHKRFRRHHIKPVCADLQNQILKCYTENKRQSLTCSNIASLYIQCVDDAKQSKKLSTGG